MPKRLPIHFVALLLVVNAVLGADSKYSESELLQWNLRSTVGDYKRCGRKSPKWDEEAETALRVFAEVRSRPVDDARGAELNKAVRLAIVAGCDDFFIRYLRVRGSSTGNENPKAVGKTLSERADGMAAAGYSPIRVFYACLRASAALRYTEGRNHPVVHKYRLQAGRALLQVLQDKSTPFREVYDACYELLVEIQYSETDLPVIWDQLEKPLLQNWPDEALTCSLEGFAWISRAWVARGYGVAGTVTEAGWKTFNDDLIHAREALEKGWGIDPKEARIPCQMITVALGLQWQRGKMET